MQIKQVGTIVVLKSDKGKHFVKTDGTVMGIELWLGKEDKAENYKEVQDEVEDVK